MNGSYNDSDIEDPFPHLRVGPMWIPIYVIFYLPIMVLSVAGNALVLISYHRELEIRKRCHSYFIASLALVDLVTGLIAIPCTIVARLVVTPFTCMARTRPILHIPAYTLCAASVNHLVVISTDRYLAVTQVLKYPSIMTQRLCYSLIAIAWGIALAFGFTPVLGFFKTPADLDICDGSRYQAKSVTLHSLAIIALIPAILSVVVAIYIRVIIVARRASHKRCNMSPTSPTSSSASDRETNARNRATVTMAMVLGAFIFCWLPTVFKHIYEINNWHNFEAMFAIRTTVEMMAYSNSMINPIIYGYRNQLFRKSYKELLGKVFRRPAITDKKTCQMRFRITSNTSNTDVPISP